MDPIMYVHSAEWKKSEKILMAETIKLLAPE